MWKLSQSVCYLGYLSSRVALLVKSQNGFPPKRLDFLDLSENNLEGDFTDWLAEMEVGSTIRSDNKFSGSLPTRLFQSLSLSVLSPSRETISLVNFQKTSVMLMRSWCLCWLETLFPGQFQFPFPIFTACYCWTCQEIDFLATHTRCSALRPCSLLLISPTMNSQVRFQQLFLRKLRTLHYEKIRSPIPCHGIQLLCESLNTSISMTKNIAGELPTFLSQIFTLPSSEFAKFTQRFNPRKIFQPYYPPNPLFIM